MFKFKCKQTGNIIVVNSAQDAENMRLMEHYEEVVEKTLTLKKAVK